MQQRGYCLLMEYVIGSAGVTGRRPFRRRGSRFPFCPRPSVGGVVDAGRRKAVPLTTGRAGGQ